MQGTISSIPTELRTKIGNVFRRHLRASVCLLCVKCAPQWLWKCSMNENCINQLKFKFEVYSCFTVFSTVGSHYDLPWRALSYLVKIKRGAWFFGTLNAMSLNALFISVSFQVCEKVKQTNLKSFYGLRKKQWIYRGRRRVTKLHTFTCVWLFRRNSSSLTFSNCLNWKFKLVVIDWFVSVATH